MSGSASDKTAGNTRGRSSRTETPKRVLLSRALLILSALILMLIGLVMIYSASSVEAIAEGSSPTHYLVKQMQWIVISAIACVLAARVPYRFWLTKIGAWVPWSIVVLLLLITAASGYVGLGAQRWMGIGSFTFQPSELGKIVVILALAALISEYESGEMELRWFVIKTAVVVIVPAVLIYLQPDLGTTIIVVSAAIITLWFGGVNWKVILGGLSGMFVLGVIGIIAEPYRLTRFTTFLHPFEDPTGDGYQIINSLYAFSSGGLMGVGLGNSYQKYNYLPEAHTDFIFSIIGEELGFIGAAFVILCFIVFIWAGCQIANDATTLQGRAIAGGATGIIGFQALINTACSVGFFPVTGKPLPFVSAGGSSLLATLILVGLILSVSLHTDLRSSAQRRRDDLLVLEGGAASDPVRQSRSARPRKDATGDQVVSRAEKGGRKAKVAPKAAPKVAPKVAPKGKDGPSEADARRERSTSSRYSHTSRERREKGIELADSKDRRRR